MKKLLKTLAYKFSFFRRFLNETELENLKITKKVLNIRMVTTLNLSDVEILMNSLDLAYEVASTGMDLIDRSVLHKAVADYFKTHSLTEITQNKP